jgi:hypothetical protein
MVAESSHQRLTERQRVELRHSGQGEKEDYRVLTRCCHYCVMMRVVWAISRPTMKMILSVTPTGNVGAGPSQMPSSADPDSS